MCFSFGNPSLLLFPLLLILFCYFTIHSFIPSLFCPFYLCEWLPGGLISLNLLYYALFFLLLISVFFLVLYCRSSFVILLFIRLSLHCLVLSISVIRCQAGQHLSAFDVFFLSFPLSNSSFLLLLLLIPAIIPLFNMIKIPNLVLYIYFFLDIYNS